MLSVTPHRVKTDRGVAMVHVLKALNADQRSDSSNAAAPVSEIVQVPARALAISPHIFKPVAKVAKSTRTPRRPRGRCSRSSPASCFVSQFTAL